jgi:uncharacterized membrane protein YqgA involved in biofilm formation
MEGTIVNTLAVIVGGTVGVALGRRIPDLMRQTVMMGVGLAVIVIGVQMALQTQDFLGVIVSLVVGGVPGEMLRIEAGLEALGRWAERAVASRRRTESGTIAAAFVTSSLLFCVGPMTVLGAIQDGLGQPPVLLYTKSALDGVSAIAIGAALGGGVLLSAVTVLVYQGAITAAAGAVQGALTPSMTRELTAVGGILIVGLGLGILQIKRIRVGSFLPALPIAVLVHVLLPWLHEFAQRFGR